MTLTQLISMGGKLREARLQQGVSLEEIASGINVRHNFLNQIEQKITPALPEPYVRGIIHLYAKRLGVSLEQLAEAEAIMNAEAGPAAAQPQAPLLPDPVVPSKDNRAADGSLSEGLRRSQRKILVGLAILAAGSLGISMFWMSRENGVKPVQEISFSDAVKEQEAKYAAQARKTDSAARSAAAAVQLTRGDSLLLEGKTTDSVLVTIAIDHAMPRHFKLSPHDAIQWRAGTSFLLSVSNPAALELTLNGIRLSSLSRSTKPVSNLVLSRSTIGKLQNAPD